MARTFHEDIPINEIRFRLKYLREEQNQVRFNLAEISAEINNLSCKLEEVKYGEKEEDPQA